MTNSLGPLGGNPLQFLEVPISATMTNGDVLTGDVFCYNLSGANTVILREKKSDGRATFQLIKVPNIRELVARGCPASAPVDSWLPPCNSAVLEERERQAEMLFESTAHTIGVGVSQVAQEIFDFIHKTHPDCRWLDEGLILVMGVTVSPPYTSETCRGSNPRTLERIREVVERFRERRFLGDKQRGMLPQPSSSQSSSSSLSSSSSSTANNNLRHGMRDAQPSPAFGGPAQFVRPARVSTSATVTSDRKASDGQKILVDGKDSIVEDLRGTFDGGPKSVHLQSYQSHSNSAVPSLGESAVPSVENSALLASSHHRLPMAAPGPPTSGAPPRAPQQPSLTASGNSTRRALTGAGGGRSGSQTPNLGPAAEFSGTSESGNTATAPSTSAAAVVSPSVLPPPPPPPPTQQTNRWTIAGGQQSKSETPSAAASGAWGSGTSGASDDLKSQGGGTGSQGLQQQKSAGGKPRSQRLRGKKREG